MAEYTKNYNLEKQQGNEYVSIEGLNKNFDTVDLQLKANADAIAAKADPTDIPVSLPANGGNADTVNGHTVNSDVPVNAKFTDTIYTHPVTHPASMITGLPASLPANGGNADTVDGFHITASTVIPTTLANNVICLVYE